MTSKMQQRRSQAKKKARERRKLLRRKVKISLTDYPVSAVTLVRIEGFSV